MKRKLSVDLDAICYSVLACFGFYFLTRVDSADIIGAQSVMTVLLFAFLYFLYHSRLQTYHFRDNKRRFIFAGVFSYLLALSFMAGYQMRVSGSLAPGFAGKTGLLVKSVFLAFAFFPFFEMIFAGADQDLSGFVSSGPDLFRNKNLKVSTVFFLSWGILFLCWIPVFLAYYPGIMSYDSNRQYYEAYNGIFWELQPIIHTRLIRLSLLLGRALGDYAKGVACYTLLQMAVLSASVAYSVSFVYELCRKKWVALAVTLYVGLFPTYSVLAMCVTKDIFFSAFFLTLMVLCLKRYLKTPGYPLVYDLSMFVCSIFMMLFRKNGIYGFALFAVLYILVMKKERIRILILSVVILAAGIGSYSLIRAVEKCGPGPKTEMFAVPIQQMGHVAFFQRPYLSEEETETLVWYMKDSAEWQSFNNTLADGQKASANPEAFGNIPQLIRDWTHFGLRFPDDYIDAYLGLTLGYWFTDDITISQHLGYGRENMRGLIETFNASRPIDDTYFQGVPSDSLLPGLQYLLEGMVSDEQYLNWPVVNALFRPAVTVWITMVFFGILLYKKRYRDLAAASLQLTYFATVLLGPVANIRYIYQLMLGLFALAAFVLFSPKENKEVS